MTNNGERFCLIWALGGKKTNSPDWLPEPESHHVG